MRTTAHWNSQELLWSAIKNLSNCGSPPYQRHDWHLHLLLRSPFPHFQHPSSSFDQMPSGRPMLWPSSMLVSHLRDTLHLRIWINRWKDVKEIYNTITPPKKNRKHTHPQTSINIQTKITNHLNRSHMFINVWPIKCVFSHVPRLHQRLWQWHWPLDCFLHPPLPTNIAHILPAVETHQKRPEVNKGNAVTLCHKGRWWTNFPWRLRKRRIISRTCRWFITNNHWSFPSPKTWGMWKTPSKWPRATGSDLGWSSK